MYTRNAKIRRDCFKRVKNFPGKIEDQVVTKNVQQDGIRVGGVSCVRFHPYENLVVVGGPGILENNGAGGSGSGGSSSGGQGGSAGGSASGSLSSLDVAAGRIGHVVIDKSAFLIFEYGKNVPVNILSLCRTNELL